MVSRLLANPSGYGQTIDGAPGLLRSVGARMVKQRKQATPTRKEELGYSPRDTDRALHTRGKPSPGLVLSSPYVVEGNLPPSDKLL
jgi:hypothetical protein